MLYCIEKMGKRFVEPPPFNLAKAYQDSTLQTPLIFVLTAGSDPTKMFRDFAEEMRCKYDGLSLGQGQDKKEILDHLFQFDHPTHVQVTVLEVHPCAASQTFLD